MLFVEDEISMDGLGRTRSCVDDCQLFWVPAGSYAEYPSLRWITSGYVRLPLCPGLFGIVLIRVPSLLDLHGFTMDVLACVLGIWIYTGLQWMC